MSPGAEEEPAAVVGEGGGGEVLGFGPGAPGVLEGGLVEDRRPASVLEARQAAAVAPRPQAPGVRGELHELAELAAGEGSSAGPEPGGRVVTVQRAALLGDEEVAVVELGGEQRAGREFVADVGEQALVRQWSYERRIEEAAAPAGQHRERPEGEEQQGGAGDERQERRVEAPDEGERRRPPRQAFELAAERREVEAHRVILLLRILDSEHQTCKDL